MPIVHYKGFAFTCPYCMKDIHVKSIKDYWIDKHGDYCCNDCKEKEKTSYQQKQNEEKRICPHMD